MSDAQVPAADQTLHILTLLATSRGPLPASTIAAQLGLPRSTVYHLLKTLQDHGYVMHLPQERRYGLGASAVELGSAYTRQAPLARTSRPLLIQLVERLGFSGHLAIQHGSDVLYILEERAPGSPTLVSDVDVRLPLQLTASGLAVLAALPKAQVRALFPTQKSFVQREEIPLGIDRYSRLRAALDATRARGFALERGSVTPGLASVGMPVLDHRGWPAAGLAVTFREASVRDDELPEIAREVGRTAETISARLYGGRG